MGFQDLTRDEIDLVLDKERVIRIAFNANGETFVVPVFYVWHEGALCGLTTPGRKTRLGEANPEVAFQIDSTFVTGPWEWASVAGQGRFSHVANPAEFGPFAVRLREKLTDSPEWAAKLLQDRFAKFGMYAWRIEPRDLSGRAHGPYQESPARA
jgi:nitroimidazol reductase NimA-like FMN-containing flavoprotein (pyridoxamine 5'-phosphate oxidase superfamily)